MSDENQVMKEKQMNAPEVLGDMFPRCKECGEMMQGSTAYKRGMFCPECESAIIVGYPESARMIPDDSERGQKLVASANLPLMIGIKQRHGRRGRVYLVHGKPHIRCPQSAGTCLAVRVTSVGSVYVESVKRIELSNKEPRP